MAKTRWMTAMALVAWSVAVGAALAAPPGKAASKETRININEASRSELMKLEGVGPAMADRIIAHRNARGPFKRVKDLEKVDGVPPAIVERNADRLSVK